MSKKEVQIYSTDRRSESLVPQREPGTDSRLEGLPDQRDARSHDYLSNPA